MQFNRNDSSCVNTLVKYITLLSTYLHVHVHVCITLVLLVWPCPKFPYVFLDNLDLHPVSRKKIQYKCNITGLVCCTQRL